MTQLFHIQRVGKSYGGRVVLQDLSLTVSKGDVIGILGAHGSGKTTLLRCLMLLEPIDRGVIEYGGHPVIEGATGKGRRGVVQHVKGNRFRRSFGFVLPRRNLFPHRTVLQNVIEGAVHVHRQPRAQAIETGRSLLATVEMADKANLLPGALSPGEQQRVALARAFATQPEVVFLDDISAGLDPLETAALTRALRSLRETEDAAIVMATHQARFAAEFAKLLCFLHEGRFAAKGAAKRLVSDPEEGPFRQFLEAVRASW